MLGEAIGEFAALATAGRPAPPDEIAPAIACLASDDASFVDGAIFSVDGGAHSGLLSQPDTAGLTGSLHLHATDGASEWWIDLDERASVVAVPGHRQTDTAIRATRSDLLLWLTNRQQPGALDISGPPQIAARWTRLRR